MIAANGADILHRLLAGSITLTFFTYRGGQHGHGERLLRRRGAAAAHRYRRNLARDAGFSAIGILMIIPSSPRIGTDVKGPRPRCCSAASCTALAACLSGPRRGGHTGKTAGAGNLDRIAERKTQVRAAQTAAPTSLHRIVAGNTFLPVVTPYRQRGIATWYGRKLRKPTSSGERLRHVRDDPAQLSCDSSYVRVTNLSNGRSIVVRVNRSRPFTPSASSTFLRGGRTSSACECRQRSGWKWAILPRIRAAREPPAAGIDGSGALTARWRPV